MKIALINVSGRLSMDGSRMISALLKRAGHSVKSVFMVRQKPIDSKYSSKEIEQLIEILDDADLAMIAVYSLYAIRAVKVTELIHKRYPGMMVIWGGPHCISAPDHCIQYADGVCYSEADAIIVDLVNKIENGDDYLTTPNMAFNVNGIQIVNKIVPLFADLDSLPYYDNRIEDHFVLEQKLLPMTKELMKKYFVTFPGTPTFHILTARGCPFKCSYCNNRSYIRMYGQNPMRFRSDEHFIGEIEQNLNTFDFFSFVAIADDDIFMRPVDQIKEFAEKYKKRVGIPFGACGSANTFKKEKMEILLDANMKIFEMGVQSASQRILNEVFDRNIKVAKTKDIFRQIEPYMESHSLKIMLDFITDNPYETEDDIIQMYYYLVDLPPQVIIHMFLLTFFPGTPIYNRALEDGIIHPFSEKTFRDMGGGPILYQNNYSTLLLFFCLLLHRHPRLMRFVPRHALRILGARPIRKIASIFPKSLYAPLVKAVQKY
jgi:radical SAM superfamily enzyme YgiQ (UPF0313 family)